MRHTIYEKRINPTLWRDPIPVDPEQIPVLGREDYEARIQALWQMPQASEYATILIYGDREHFSNVEYFTGYDPRWEETLLILPRGGKPSILVGNEGIGYIAVSPVEMNIEFYQTFSLMGQPNDVRSRRLEEILKDAIALQSGKLGVIGFKSYDPALHTIGAFVTDVPHYIIQTLERIVPAQLLKNATDLLADCEYGLKHHVSAKEIVLYELTGTRVSRGVLNCLQKLRPGMSELEASRNCLFDGAAANMHPNINFGDKNLSLGLASPTDAKRLQLGELVGAGFGKRGCLVHKIGMYVENASQIPAEKAGYLTEFMTPYFDTVASWYEMLRLGASCGEIYEMVDTELGLKRFGCTLNPGHYTHTDEWTHSGFTKGSRHTLHSGLGLQCDFTPSWQSPYMAAHTEDGLYLADAALREQIRAIAPGCWARIQARQEFMRKELGIQLPDEVLPLSDLQGVCFPYLADLNVVLACR